MISVNLLHRGLGFRVFLATLALAATATGTADAQDDYYVYSAYDPPGIGDVVCVGGYVEDYGTPNTWGDEIRYLFFASYSMGPRRSACG